MTHSYSIYEYGKMIDDRASRGAYWEALRQAIKPGTVALDLGCGSGLLSLLACQCGARRVYAIEAGDIIHLARRLAAANGFANRIEFIQAHSTQISLPEPVTVIISDLHGALPLFEQAIPSIIDARRRFLAPGGIIIPQRETLWVAVVAAPEVYRDLTGPWDDNDYGLDLSAARQMVINGWHKRRLKPDQLLVEPQKWATLDYVNIKSSNVRGEVSWKVANPGAAHGLVVWFDSTLFPGVDLSIAPGTPPCVYVSFFLPWSEPVQIELDDIVKVDLRADLVGKDYVWSWRTTFLKPGIPGSVKKEFKQSSFFGDELLSLPRLRKLADRFVPNLNMSGEIDRFILSKMNGESSLEEIAHQLVVQFPKTFTTFPEALTRVGEMSEKYSS